MRISISPFDNASLRTLYGITVDGEKFSSGVNPYSFSAATVLLSYSDDSPSGFTDDNNLASAAARSILLISSRDGRFAFGSFDATAILEKSISTSHVSL